MPFGASRLAFLAKSIIAGITKRAIGVSVFGDTRVDEGRAKYGTSVKFDGTGDYIKVSPENTGDFTFASGEAFTIEFWFNYQNDTGSASAGLMSNKQGGGDANNFFILFRNFDTKIQLYATAQVNTAVASGAISTNTWTHVALVRDTSNNVGFFVNGSRTQSYSGVTNTIGSSSQEAMGIGGFPDGALPFNQGGNGWIDDIRVSNTARYDPTATSLTLPDQHVNDADTKFLIAANSISGNTEIFDDNGDRTTWPFTVRFGGEIDTGQSKFGSSSWQQTSDGEGLKANFMEPMDVIGANSQFTIEMWVRKSSDQSRDQYLLHGNNEWSIVYDDVANTLEYRADNGDTTRITGGSLNNNTWYHIAVSRDSSNNTKMFINGTQTGSTFTNDDRAWVNLSEMLLGVSRNGDNSWIGHIDEFRISDTQRYTGNFTAPTEAFENDVNTLCLYHFENTDAEQLKIYDDNGGDLPS